MKETVEVMQLVGRLVGELGMWKLLMAMLGLNIWLFLFSTTTRVISGAEGFARDVAWEIMGMDYKMTRYAKGQLTDKEKKWLEKRLKEYEEQFKKKSRGVRYTYFLTGDVQRAYWRW